MTINRQIFFSEYRKNLDIDNRLTQKEVDSLNLFLDMTETSPVDFNIHEWAYIYATVFHETQYTFDPVEEAFQLSDNWRKRNLKYYPYHGRGYVQITWKRNYQVFSKLLNLDLVKKPELAFLPDVAFKILTIGTKQGLFTGQKISDHIRDGKINYETARRVINGNDKAVTIADYAKEFERIIKICFKF